MTDHGTSVADKQKHECLEDDWCGKQIKHEW